MNSIYKYILISLCALTFSSCLQMEEQTPEEQAQEELVNLSFIASTEDDASTKTTLDGKLGEGTHRVLWNPEDVISVIPSGGNTFYPFTNTITENSQTAVFEGQSQISETYHAFYPHHSVLYVESGIVAFRLIDELTYQEDSFPSHFPMAANATVGNEISFNNLCGLLALKMTGTETIKRINLISRNKQNLAGTFYVNLADSDLELETMPFGDMKTSLSMDCGPEGVTLKESEPTVFYFILPPATYENLVFQFITEDGGVMLKRTEKPLTIKRSVLTPTGTLSYVESLAIDLSERGTANCYIVPPIFSSYTFDCTKKGNGSDSVGEAASAEVVWETKNTDEVITEGEIISSVELIDGKVRFYLPVEPVPGNAVIAVKDVSGNILWSWHVWVTDYDPENDFDTYVSGAKMMDRNLGALNTVHCDVLSFGLFYQQGRKDPFVGCANVSNMTFAETAPANIIKYISSGNADLSVKNPHVLYGSKTTSWTVDKGIYDPCPVGWKVPSETAWNGFQSSNMTTFTYGVSYTYPSSSPDAYFPLTGDTQYGQQTLRSPGTTGYLWTTTSGYAYNFKNRTKTSRSSQDENPVRCIVDDQYVDLRIATLAITDIKDITESSATVTALITYPGKSEITSRGVVYGTSPMVTVENGTKVESTDISDEFTVSVTGLQMAKKYYVRGYAVDGLGIHYSDEQTFNTLFVGDGINLSEEGTANSYIVPPVYAAYTFDCTNKGNGSESVGDVASAVVLWETKNTSDVVAIGEVISSVEIQDGKVKFFLPTAPVQGNALIAVKDSEEKILWSWHIWVTDYDPENDYDTYISGAKMMDRNLGALSNTMNDPLSYGLYYQWGRKDPSVGPCETGSLAVTAPSDAIIYLAKGQGSNTLEYSIQNPTTIIDWADWNKQEGLWHHIKTIYDPCPVGWRVPDSGAWEGVVYSKYMIAEPYSIPATYYPACGHMYGQKSISELGAWGYYWSTSMLSSLYVVSTSKSAGFNTNAADYQVSVRCMKETDVVYEGDNEDFVEDDDFEWNN